MEYLGYIKYLPIDHKFINMKSQFNGAIHHIKTLKYAYPYDWLENYQESEEKCWIRTLEEGIIEDSKDVIVQKDDLPQGKI